MSGLCSKPSSPRVPRHGHLLSRTRPELLIFRIALVCTAFVTLKSMNTGLRLLNAAAAVPPEDSLEVYEGNIVGMMECGCVSGIREGMAVSPAVVSLCLLFALDCHKEPFVVRWGCVVGR